MSTPTVIMIFPEGYPEELEQMGQIIGRVLLALGLPVAVANAKAFEMLEAIRTELGGSQFYLSRGQSYELSVRDAQIYDEWNGNNFEALARKYKLTVVQVRNIVRRGRARDMQRRQQDLFGAPDSTSGKE